MALLDDYQTSFLCELSVGGQEVGGPSNKMCILNPQLHRLPQYTYKISTHILYYSYCKEIIFVIINNAIVEGNCVKSWVVAVLGLSQIECSV